MRREVHIDGSADEVWALVGEPAALSTWFPSILTSTVISTAEGTTRRCRLGTGIELVEEIVTVDHRLRRFQYRLTGGVPVQAHLATVDVLDLAALGAGPGCLVVYATDVQPDALATVLSGAIGEALANLKVVVEGRAAA